MTGKPRACSAVTIAILRLPAQSTVAVGRSRVANTLKDAITELLHDNIDEPNGWLEAHDQDRISVSDLTSDICMAIGEFLDKFKEGQL